MVRYFLDTSALVKLYVEEVGSAGVAAIFDRSSSGEIAVLSITRVEFRSAVRRRERAREISPPDATQLIEDLDRDLASVILVQPLTNAALQVAASLVDRHALRAYDALQLASAVDLLNAGTTDRLTFVAADKRLCEAAQQTTLVALNPEEQP